ncbi:SDR family oxidoreductase [Natrialbaceae archaeon A-CW3]
MTQAAADDDDAAATDAAEPAADGTARDQDVSGVTNTDTASNSSETTTSSGEPGYSTMDTGAVDAETDDSPRTDEATATTDDRYTRKRCVLVTDCASPVGAATARAFLAEDWFVVAAATDREAIADLADAGCETIELDVTDPAQVARAVERTVESGGAIDCLVTNAGYAQLGPIEDVSTASLQRQFDVNVYGPHRLTRAALPHMRAQGDGRIINVSSILGRLSFAGTGPYAGSKHALEAMSDALRAEVEEFGLEVVVVEPGPIETATPEGVDEEVPNERTPAYESLYELFDEAELVGGDGPLAVDPEDVAAAILHAGTCPEPPARYPVGPVAEYGLYARFLPDRLRDAVYGLLRRLV